MGFFKNPIKAIKGAVSKYVPPFGKYITGRETERQKFLYNNDLNTYNNYASEAQSTIDNLNKQLNESAQKLQSIEQQKYQHGQNSGHLHNQVEQYQRGLQNLEQQKASLGSEANALQAAFEGFKNKAPALAGKISEVQQLPNNFQQMFDSVLQQKERLRGLSEDEASSEINKYKQDVENLKKQREQAENSIRQQMDSMTKEHTGLESEKANLENRFSLYKLQQDRLLQDTGNFNNARTQLESVIRNYQDEQQRLENEYNSHKSQTESLNSQLNSYAESAQNHLNSLGEAVGFRANKLKKASKLTGLTQSAALAALTFGAGMYLASAAAAGTAVTGSGAATTGAATSGSLGSSILGSLGSGLQSAAPLLGIGHFMNKMNKGKSFGDWQRIALNNRKADSNINLPSLSQQGLFNNKIAIPELGGLKQSLSHFNMPTVPKLQDLPKLSESLGKITALGDLDNLSLGLPQMTSADGRKYSSEVLYDMDFLKKLKKVSRNLGSPYLRSNAAGNNRLAYA
jgi:predicted  nucleic acid-binding Zn-ribbon protein